MIWLIIVSLILTDARNIGPNRSMVISVRTFTIIDMNNDVLANRLSDVPCQLRLLRKETDFVTVDRGHSRSASYYVSYTCRLW